MEKLLYILKMLSKYIRQLSGEMTNGIEFDGDIGC